MDIAVMGGVVQIILKGEVGDGAVWVHEVVVAGVDVANGLQGLRVGVGAAEDYLSGGNGVAK